jgi:hypothetical protein
MLFFSRRFKIYFKNQRKGVQKMTNTTLLEDYIQKSGYKKGFIAKQLGLTSYGFTLKVNNKSEIKANEMTILCKLLNINAKDKEAIFFAN